MFRRGARAPERAGPWKLNNEQETTRNDFWGSILQKLQSEVNTEKWRTRKCLDELKRSENEIVSRDA